MTNAEREPLSYADAIKDVRWKDAMTEEIAAMHQNNTNCAQTEESECQKVGSKWIFQIKYKADGGVERFKARLVARGFTQEYGLMMKPLVR